MKKFAKNLLLLSVIVMVIVMTLDCLIARSNRVHENFKLHYDELLNNRTQSDCVILGTSHAMFGIRPSYLKLPNLSVYNFALSGANPESYYHWYTQLFKKTYQKPKFIIFAVDWFFFDEAWLWRYYEQSSEYFPRDIFLRNLMDYRTFDPKMLLLNRFAFIKNKNKADLLHLVFPVLDTLNPIEEYDRGFIPITGFRPNKFTMPDEYVMQKQVDYFKKLLALIAKDDIKVIFVNLPEFAPAEKYLTFKSYGIYAELSKKYNIPMLNYNIEKRSYINESKKYFHDWGHLSPEGSAEFSRMLNKDLIKLLTNR